MHPACKKVADRIKREMDEAELLHGLKKGTEQLDLIENSPKPFKQFLDDTFLEANIEAAVEKTTSDMKASGLFKALDHYDPEDLQTREALTDIYQAFTHFLPNDPLNLGVARIRDVFKHWFENTPDNLLKAAKEMGAELSVYNSIYQVTADDLASGEYHIYRGSLNITGQQLHSLCLQALDKLVESGAWTPEAAQQQRRVINQEIATVG